MSDFGYYFAVIVFTLFCLGAAFADDPKKQISRLLWANVILLAFIADRVAGFAP